jgi:hypothetical protein
LKYLKVGFVLNLPSSIQFSSVSCPKKVAFSDRNKKNKFS